MKNIKLSFWLKLCCLLTCFCIVFSSCSSNINQSNVSPQLKQFENADFSTHYTITVGFWNIDHMVDNIKNDPMLQYIESMFNITIVPTSFSWSDYQERQQVLVATDSLPDVTATLTSLSADSADAVSLQKFIRAGAIRALPSDMSSFPLIQQTLAQFNSTASKEPQYYLPRTSFMDAKLGASDAAMIVRKDWLENLNLSEPTNMDEFINMVSAFANNDPDQDGINNTIGYNVNAISALGKWLILAIAPECNVLSYTQRDGMYLPSYILPEFTQVVKTYQTLYQTGGLDPLFYAKKNNDAVADFCSGKLGALEYKSSPGTLLELETIWKTYQDISFEESVTVLNIFPASDGICYSNSSSSFWSETVFSSSVTDDKMERILYLSEYLLSDEGLRLTQSGIENVDYIIEDGIYKSLLDTNNGGISTILLEKYPSLALWKSLASWGGTWSDFTVTQESIAQYGIAPITLSSKAISWCNENTQLVNRPYDFYIFPQKSSEIFTTERALNAWINAIIGEGDAVESWENFIQTLYDEGLQDYLNTINTQYSEYLKSNKE